MTTHYGDTVTAESIMWDRDLYKRLNDSDSGMPPAFAIMSRGDAIAYACFNYMEFLDKGEKVPSVKDYFANEEDEEDRIYATKVLSEVVELYNTTKDE